MRMDHDVDSDAALLERGPALAAIAAAIRSAASGRGRTVIVSGPHGIGKTSVLRAASGGAGGSLRTLHARGAPAERSFPFGGAIQLFEPVVRGAGASLLEGAAALAGPVLDGRALSDADVSVTSA